MYNCLLGTVRVIHGSEQLTHPICTEADEQRHQHLSRHREVVSNNNTSALITASPCPVWSGGEWFPVLTFYGFMAPVETCRSSFATVSQLMLQTVRQSAYAYSLYVRLRVPYTFMVGGCQPCMRLGVLAKSINRPRDEHRQASLRRDRPHPARIQVARYTTKIFRHPLSQNKYCYRLSWNLFRHPLLPNRFVTACCGIDFDDPLDSPIPCRGIGCAYPSCRSDHAQPYHDFNISMHFLKYTSGGFLLGGGVISLLRFFLILWRCPSRPPCKRS